MIETILILVMFVIPIGICICHGLGSYRDNGHVTLTDVVVFSLGLVPVINIFTAFLVLDKALKYMNNLVLFKKKEEND